MPSDHIVSVFCAFSTVFLLVYVLAMRAGKVRRWPSTIKTFLGLAGLGVSIIFFPPMLLPPDSHGAWLVLSICTGVVLIASSILLLVTPGDDSAEAARFRASALLGPRMRVVRNLSRYGGFAIVMLGIIMTVTHFAPKRILYIVLYTGLLVIFIPGMAISLYLWVKVYRQQKR